MSRSKSSSAALDQIHGAVVARQQIHRVPKAFGKRAPAVEPAVAVGIGEHADAIARRAVVAFGPLMRVRLDHQQPALAIERHADRRDDLRLAGDEFELVAIVGDARRSGIASTRR